MNQYRLTRRGKLVVFLLILLMVYAIIWFLGKAILPNRDASADSSGVQLESSSLDTSISITTTINTETVSTSESLSSESATAEETTSVSLPQNILSSEDERTLLNASKVINFSQDASELSEDMKALIREFYRTSLVFDDFQITVRGVALRVLDEAKAINMAKARANVVKKYLISLGVEEKRILVEHKLIDPNDYERDKLINAIVTELFFTGYQKDVK